MQFAFKAQRGITGEIYEGIAEAKDKFALVHEMKERGVTVITAREAAVSKGDFLKKLNAIFIRIKFKEKMFFASNLAEMISAGLSLSRALGVIERQSENPKMKEVAKGLLVTIDQGGSFARALGAYPKVFSPIMVAMVEAGEKSGRMPESLRIVADQMNKTYMLRKKIRGAMMYPAIILVAMILIGVLMLVYIVPTLSATFEELGADLPFTTQLIVSLSDFIGNHYLLFFGIVIGGIIALVRLSKTRRGGRMLSYLVLHFPIFASITREMNAAVTARTISSLLSSGVDVVESLEIAERVLQNDYYKEVMAKAREDVPKGKTLSRVFQDAEKLYPAFVGEMVLVGEETGKLADMLLKLAIFYENEVDSVTKDLSTVIEPLIMVFVGAGVGFFALSMIQPIYSLGNNL